MTNVLKHGSVTVKRDSVTVKQGSATVKRECHSET